eukprot:gene7292-biopygen4543
MHWPRGWPVSSGRERWPFGGQKTGIHARWHPIRVGYGTLVAPPESREFRDLVDFDAWWTPLRPSPPPLERYYDMTWMDGRVLHRL